MIFLQDSDDENEADQDGPQLHSTTTSSSSVSLTMQYLYIQMEYCEKSTLRQIIDEGLYKDVDRVWILFREIVEGLGHVHAQVCNHFQMSSIKDEINR